MKNIRQLQLSLKYDRETDLMLVNFGKNCVFWLKVYLLFVTLILPYVYSSVFMENKSIHLIYMDVYILKYFPKSVYYFSGVVKCSIMFTLTFFMLALPYFFLYNTLYIRMILKIFTRYIRLTGIAEEDVATAIDNEKYQKLVKCRLVFLIEKHNELLRYYEDREIKFLYNPANIFRSIHFLKMLTKKFFTVVALEGTLISVFTVYSFIGVR